MPNGKVRQMQNRGSRRVIREPLLLMRECVAGGRER